MRGRLLRIAVAALAGAALVTGCTGAAASREGADLASGKELFAEKCGSCHVMADAGTRGQLGPNLDNAFGYPRQQKIDESTFFQITIDQMRIPAPPMPDFDDPDSKARLSEEQLVSIAEYVSRCAGVQLIKNKPAECNGPPNSPQAIFTASCGSCHTLSEAGTKGTTGPNLDESKPGLQEAITQIRNGGDGMPAFKGDLTDAQIRAIAEFIVRTTGGG